MAQVPHRVQVLLLQSHDLKNSGTVLNAVPVKGKIMSKMVFSDNVGGDGTIYESIGEHIRSGGAPSYGLPTAVKLGRWSKITITSDGTTGTAESDNGLSVAMGEDTLSINDFCLDCMITAIEASGTVECTMEHTQTTSLIKLANVANFTKLEIYVLLGGDS